MRFLLIALTFALLSCAQPKNPTFAKWSAKNHNWNVPVKVYDDADVLWFSKALDMWNQPGCKVFEKTDDMMKADIMVIRKAVSAISGNKKKKGKKIKLAGSWNKNGVITIYSYGGALRDYGTLAHELGHSLGLKHDYKLKSSIMMPGALKRFGRGLSPSATDIDLAAIKKRYCR